jgi:O-Antigen ligase
LPRLSLHEGAAASIDDTDTANGTVAVRLAPSIVVAGGLVAVAVFAIWTVHDGGFAPQQWLPGALAIVGLVAMTFLSADMRDRLRVARLAPILLGLYVVWSYASISWAQVRGDALDGANRTSLYFCIYLFFVGLPLTARGRLILVSSWAFAVGVVGSVELARAAIAAGPYGRFVLGRFASPITYPDANAAVFLMAAMTLAVLASHRGGHRLVRIAAAGVCAVLLDLAVLCQSRASLIVLPLAVLCYLAVTRTRLRALVQLLVISVAVAPAVPWLLDVYSAVVDGHGYGPALARACAAVGASALIGMIGTAIFIEVDDRVVVPESVCRVFRRAIVVAATCSTLGLTLGYLLLGHGAMRATRAWHDFTTNKGPTPNAIHFLSGTGTSRYDVWRIALRQFESRPLLGVGSDNYLVGYLEQRRTYETTRYPQSIELRALSETGIVGALLFFGFVGVALQRAIVSARRDSAYGAAIACVVGFAYWFFHASVDWFWEYPALAGPAFALLGIAGGSLYTRRERQRMTRMARRIFAVATAAVVGAAAVLLIAPWIAVREMDAAVAVAPASVDRAYALLRSAARWNPVSDAPAITEATLAANAGDRRHEERALTAALKRNPWSWYTYFMLGIVAGQQHRPAAAQAWLARAHRLSPRDLVVIYAQRRLASGSPLTEREVGRILRLVTQTLRGVRQH